MTLAELLGMVAAHTRIRLNLDLKEYSALDAMAELVESRGMKDRVVLTGVTVGRMDAVRESCRGLPYFLNAFPSFHARLTRSGARAVAGRIVDLGAIGLNTQPRFTSRTLARALSAERLSLSVWTVDRERGLRHSLRLPVDNITTRRIDLALALRDGGKAAGGGKGGER
jgi:glycerophosphoryl diester phosphodiesterase